MNLQTWCAEVRGRPLLLAAHIGVSPVTVSEWCTGKKAVSLERCVPIERFTDGAVTCEELRPDKAAQFAYLRAQGQPAPDAAATTAGV